MYKVCPYFQPFVHRGPDSESHPQWSDAYQQAWSSDQPAGLWPYQHTAETENPQTKAGRHLARHVQVGRNQGSRSILWSI